jgi:hypothetical protein
VRSGEQNRHRLPSRAAANGDRGGGEHSLALKDDGTVVAFEGVPDREYLVVDGHNAVRSDTLRPLPRVVFPRLDRDRRTVSRERGHPEPFRRRRHLNRAMVEPRSPRP